MNDCWYHWQHDILFLKVHLHPGAKQNEINGLMDKRLRIRIKSLPVDGKANKQLIDMLAKEFCTKKSQVRIAAGQQTRNKTIEIHSPALMPEWFIALTKAGNNTM